ncbi:MAG: hypothetical protein AB7R67_10665, partial [Vicinamibacterales bacterium]
RRLEEEIATRVAELRARFAENDRRVADELAELQTWRTRKQQEEGVIAEAVGHFVAENPIARPPAGGRGQGDADVR